MIGIKDNSDQLVKELRRLAAVLENEGGGGGRTIYNVDQSGQDSDSGVTLFSTGKDATTITERDANEEYRQFQFGFPAQTVNIRTSDDIHIAFQNPYNSSGVNIPVSAGESPFTIGGDGDIGASTMWVQRADSATSDPAVKVIAYR